jgi:hypothetical protein
MKIIRIFATWFSKQRLSGRIFLILLGSLLVIGVCGILFTFMPRPAQQLPSITATYKGADSVIYVTWTPGPPTVTPTSTPTLITSLTPTITLTPTASPTATYTEIVLATGLPTLSFETPTVVHIPTISRATTGILVLITAVDKELEFVDIQNAGYPTVSLYGWVLVSETGNQRCPLRGIIQSKEVLRIWAGEGQVGISCGFKNPIWLDQESDPAVLYNAKGEEVSRYP